MQRFLIKNRFIGFIAFVSALSACGGGGDEPAAPAPVPAPIVSAGVPAAVIPTPPSLPDDSEGFTDPGALAFLAFATDGTTATDNATITYAAQSGSLSFASASASTVDNWTNVTWLVNGAPNSGRLAFDGNAAIACAGPLSSDAEVFVSANMTPVDNTAALVGSTFAGFDCETEYTIVYNLDGTLTASYPGESEVISAPVTAELFTAAGQTDADGSNFKARVYTINLGDGPRYAIVVIGRDLVSPGVFKESLELLIQQP